MQEKNSYRKGIRALLIREEDTEVYNALTNETETTNNLSLRENSEWI